ARRPVRALELLRRATASQKATRRQPTRHAASSGLRSPPRPPPPPDLRLVLGRRQLLRVLPARGRHRLLLRRRRPGHRAGGGGAARETWQRPPGAGAGCLQVPLEGTGKRLCVPRNRLLAAARARGIAAGTRQGVPSAMSGTPAKNNSGHENTAVK